MKLTENPPVEPTYTLVLTESELVALGALSARHENRDVGRIGFWGRLPAALMPKVDELLNMQPESRTIILGVNWMAQ